MNAGEMWRERCKTFWLSVAPYIRYVISGGLGVTIILFLTVGGYFYMRLLSTVDDQFPAAWVAFALLFPLTARVPLRSFLREADVVFLMPAESDFPPYLQAATIYSFAVRSVLPILVWSVCWPLYMLASGAPQSMYFYMCAVILLIVAVNANGSKEESRIASARTRRSFAILRWAVTAGALATALVTESWAHTGLVLTVIAAYAISVRFPRKLPVHWERLIALERRQRAAIYTFLNGFVDVDELPRRVRRRPLARIARFIRHRRQSAWTYLYFLTWIRSESFAIVLRLAVIAAVVIVFASDLWLKVAAFWLGLLLCGLQLSTLSRFHRHDLWTHLYPFPMAERLPSVFRLCRVMLSVVAVLLFVPLAVWLTSWSEWVVSAAGALLILWLSVRFGVENPKNGTK